MADNNEDQTVSLREIDQYLGDHVTPEVAPQNQLPMIVGNGREKLTDIFPDILAQLREGKKGQLQLFTATESRGIESDVLAEADTNIVEMYFAFQKALEDKQFLFVPKGQAEKGRSENDYADFYYKKLSEEPSLERLHSSMRRNYAAALQDDAQQVMNDWMKNNDEYTEQTNDTEDAEEKKSRLPRKVFSEKVKAFPASLERAAELLGKEHYMFATLQARKHFFEGYILANSNKNPNTDLGNSALEQFRQALQFQPELPQAYWQMSKVYGYNFRQPDSAEVYARKAIELHPTWIKAYTTLAFLLTVEYCDFDRAKTYLDMAGKIDSNSVFVWKAWGDYYGEQNIYYKSERCYKKAIQLDSTYTNTYNNLGLDYKSQKKYDTAVKYFKKAIQIDSTYTLAYCNLGTVYSNTRRYDLAEKYFKKAIQIDSTYTNAYNKLGIFYLNTRRYEEAEKYYKKAIQLDSTFIYSCNNLGTVYLNTRRYEEAENQYKKAIELDSTYIKSYYLLGQHYFKTQRYEEAEKYHKIHLEKSIQIDSTDAQAYNNMGNFYARLHRYDEAEKQFKKAFQIDTTYSGAIGNLAIIYSKTNRNEEAEIYFKKSLELDSTNAIDHNNLGHLYESQRRYAEAEEYYKKAIQLDSTYTSPYSNLGSLYKVTLRYSEAEKLFKEIIQLDSTKWQAYANLGAMYQTLQRWEESGTMTLKSIESGPPIWELRAMLGNAYTHLPGKMEDAKKELDKVVEKSPNSPDTYIYLAQWSLKKNEKEQAWKYLAQGLEKGLENGQLDLEYLKTQPDFSSMRKDLKWNQLIQKHFPDQHKN